MKKAILASIILSVTPAILANPTMMKTQCEIPFQHLSQLNGQQEPATPTLADVKRAEAILDQTDCFTLTQQRMEALNVMKAACDHVTPDEYEQFLQAGLTLSDDDLGSSYASHPAFHWYDHAFGKVLDGVKNTVVPPGEVVLWLVYNLGYVIKTDTACFAFDVHHRRAEELVPYLDFAAVTHNHGDHYTRAFLRAMNRAHKAVYTNFFPNTGFAGIEGQAGYCKGPRSALQQGAVTLNTYESDHNKRLLGFVQPVEATVKTSGSLITIMTGGDTCKASQLTHQADVLDAFLVHPYVGLKVTEAAQILKPRLVLVSHMQEFGHFFNQWRWSWRQGYDAARQLWDNGTEAVVPVWGDKITLKRQ